VLPAALWKEALTPVTLNGKSTDYGFGWQLAQHPERGRVARHTGGWPGYTTFVSNYLDKDVTLVFLGNRELSGALTQGVYEAVKNIVFGLPYEFPKERKVAAIDKAVYDQYTGVYESEERKGFAISVTSSGGQLFLQATGQGQLEALPESATLFFVEDLPIKVEFQPAAGGKAPVMLLHQNGKHVFKRKG
jgi:hypothetical protein